MINYKTSFDRFCKILTILFTLIVFVPVNINAQSDTIQTNVPSLKNVYANDFNIGCILSYRNIGFPSDPPVTGQSAVITPNGGYLVKFHMNSMSPGNNMKPQYTVNLTASASAYSSAPASAKDSVDTHPVIRFNGDLIAQLNWAKRQGFTFRGHTLVWHSQTPGTAFFRSGYTNTGVRLSKEKMTLRMENYIKEVIRLIHEGWPGLLTAVDVVNEAVNENGSDRTTDSEWYVTFGDNTFIMKAFEFARKYTVQYGETQIKLYYNDYNTSTSTKANGIVRICGPIFRAGFLDGIGMQEHDANATPTASQWIASYNKFDTVCTQMSVTELDVNPGTGTPTAAALTAQANQYANLFKCFVDRSFKSGRGKIVSVTKDGLNDQWAFVANASLWDNLNQCKPSFYAAANLGINYNILDSLITYSDTLKQIEYTASTWSNFASALTLAKNAIAQNYSVSVSAADVLGAAKDSLQTAIAGLIKTSSLPVELISFTGASEVNGVTLSWQTATEKNNFGFEIQRSIDNREYTAVGFVKGTGTTTERQSYSYKDKISGLNKIFYRLKQVDLDGTSSFSNIVEVSGVPAKFNLSQNYPNPFNPSTNIEFQVAEYGMVNLKIFDVLGNEVADLLNEEKEPGTYTIKFNATPLASGVYYYRLQAGSFMETKKLILQK